jgi:hypothetical protein
MYDRYETTDPYYDQPEGKQAVEPLREVLNRAVISLNKEVDMLANRIAPVLRNEPTALREDVGPPVPHSSEIAGHVYELHRIANVVALLTSRVEL